jgi:signal transduction histidine kinase/CheY-like chemotaxis protein/streptogramin lyase
VSAQNDYSFELITTEERSNFGDVRDICIDRSGIVWMGVFGKGLAYYDGRKVTRLPLPGDGAFSIRRSIFTEGRDILYLNYGHAIHCFGLLQQRITDSIGLADKDGRPEVLAYARVGDEDWLWAAAPERGGRYRVLLSRNGAPLRLVPNVVFGCAGEPVIRTNGARLILKTEQGFVEIDQEGRTLRAIDTPGLDLAAVFQSNTLVDDAGNFWFSFFAQSYEFLSDRYNGLYRWDAGEAGRLSLLAGWRKEFLGLNQIGDAICLVGMTTTHANREGRAYLFSRYTAANGLAEVFPHNTTLNNMGGLIFCMTADASGILWLGGNYGLGKLTPRPSHFEKMPTAAPRGMAEDEAGNIYLGCVFVDKLSRHKPAIMKGNPAKNQDFELLKSFEIEAERREFFSLHYLDGNLLWSGKKFDLRDTIDKFYLEESREKTPYLQLIDRAGLLWSIPWYAGEMGIFDKKTGKKLKSVLVPPLQGRATEVDALYQRPSDGTVWLGTHGQGIFVFRETGELLAHYSTGPGSVILLKDNIVSAFYEDKNGELWIGHGAGLSRLNTNTRNIEHLELVPEKPWLNLVYGILPEDDDRFLWISTNRGLYRYDTREHTAMDFPLDPVVDSLEFNRASSYKARNGWMFFGGIGKLQNSSSGDRIVAFDPKKVVAYYENFERNKASVILTAFEKYDGRLKKSVAQTLGLQTLDVVRLNPGDRFFQLQFTSSDMRSPANNYYSHYLEDYDADWSAPTRSDNEIRYENLPPGTYRLHLAAGLSPTTLRQNERVIRVIVLPPWYQTWWARLLSALGIVGLFLGLRRYEMSRRLERQKAEHLRQLDQLKTRLYTNISHEFRTPLTVIMGVSENIEGHEKEKSLILRNSRNLLRLINQLLDLSKLESGKLHLNFVQGDVVSYLRYLTESFYSLADEKGIHLTFEAKEERLVMDYDAEKMQHIAYNLLSNAIKFTPAGSDGKVILHLSKAERDGLPHLKLKIRDTGIGIPPEKLPQVFDRFYQADDSHTRKEEGTGIGLALTKELVELLQGHIEASSTPGKGTEFSVWLPITNAAPLAAELHPGGGGPPHIAPESDAVSESGIEPSGDDERPLLLLIEDNADVVDYVRRLLQKDYVVHVARDGQAGIDLALELIPDIVISDVMMPKRDGYEVCETLKTDERTSHIPIILLTAKAAQTDKVQGLRHGADAFLIKPFDKAELFVRLEKLVALRRALQQRYAAAAGGNPAPDAAAAPRPIEDAFLLKLRTAVEDRLHDGEFGAPDLARSVFLGQMQVYRKLKALTGQTPSQFIRSVRLHKSLELLKSGDLTISEIAYEVGFADPNYYSRLFHETYGRPPSDFRKNADS